MYRKFLKRLIDVILSFVAGVALLPIFLIIAIAIVIDDPGPVIFKQKRVGKNKKLFWLHKFRSMKVKTPDIPTHLLKNPEQYITRVGKFLRKTSLDELPQVYDILFNKMSIIGPRPEVRKFVDIYLTELQQSLKDADKILKAELSEIIANNKAEAEKNLQEFKDEIEKEKNELVGKLKEAIDAANAQLERAQTALYTKIEETKTKLDGDIKAVEEGYEKADNILKASALAIKKFIFSTDTVSDQIKIAPVKDKVILPDNIIIYVNGDEQKLCTRKIQCTINHYCFSVDSAIDKDGNGIIDVKATSKSAVKDVFENLSTDIRQTYIASDDDSSNYWESVIEIHAPCTGDGEFIIDIDEQGNTKTGTLWFVCNTFLRNDNSPIQMLEPTYIGGK